MTMKTMYIILMDTEGDDADTIADRLAIMTDAAKLPVLGMVWSDASDLVLQAIQQMVEDEADG